MRKWRPLFSPGLPASSQGSSLPRRALEPFTYVMLREQECPTTSSIDATPPVAYRFHSRRAAPPRKARKATLVGVRLLRRSGNGQHQHVALLLCVGRRTRCGCRRVQGQDRPSRRAGSMTDERNWSCWRGEAGADREEMTRRCATPRGEQRCRYRARRARVASWAGCPSRARPIPNSYCTAM